MSNFLKSNYAYIFKIHEYSLDKYQLLILMMMIAVKITIVKYLLN